MEVVMQTQTKFGGLSEASYYMRKSGARMISAKMNRQDADALTRIAEVRGVSVASLTRRLLKRYIEDMVEAGVITTVPS
jgi:hypothetical protein